MRGSVHDRIAEREHKVRRRNFWSALASWRRRSCWSVALLLYPVAFNVYLSFTDWRKFTGPRHIRRLSRTTSGCSARFTFGQAAVNTMIWVIASLIVPVRARSRDRDPAARHPVRERVQEPDLPAARPGADRRRRHLVLCLCAALACSTPCCPSSPASRSRLAGSIRTNTVTPAIIATHVWQTVGIVMVLLLLGLAAHPARSGRGGADGRRQALADLSPHHPADC